MEAKDIRGVMVKPKTETEDITPSELIEIGRFFSNLQYGARGEDRDFVLQTIEDLQGQYIAKIPNYISAGPGYHGPIYIVIWDGGPEHHYILIRGKDGKLQSVKPEGRR